METLFKVENADGKKNLVFLARPLTMDDVIVRQYELDEKRCEFSTDLRLGVGLALKQEHIDELIEVTNIPLTDKGRLVNYNTLGALTDCWDPKDPNYFNALVKTTVSYRGIRTKERKDKRYQETCDQLKRKWMKEGEELTAEQLKDLSYALQRVITVNNDSIKEWIHDVAVKQSVRPEWFEENLTDQEKEQVAGQDDVIAKADKIIEEQRALIRAANELKYTVKRNRVEASLREQLGEEGVAYLDSIKDEKKQPGFESLAFCG